VSDTVTAAMDAVKAPLLVFLVAAVVADQTAATEDDRCSGYYGC
jgi:hypothetical protein